LVTRKGGQLCQQLTELGARSHGHVGGDDMEMALALELARVQILISLSVDAGRGLGRPYRIGNADLERPAVAGQWR
jgi:hypothetical protein